MSVSQPADSSPPKAHPTIAVSRVEDLADKSSPLDAYLVDKKRRRGNSYCPDGDLMREMEMETKEDTSDVVSRVR